MRKWCICLSLVLGLPVAVPVQATIVQINSSGTSFSPSAVTIAVGDTIRWQNASGIHTTTNGTGFADPNAGILWDEPLNSGNPTFERQFTVQGVFPFFCRPHEFFGMKGTITVEAPNNIPVARDTALVTVEDTPVVGQLHGSDLDGDPLAFLILTGPFNGTLTAFDGGTGAFTYEPAQDFNGEDTLTFEVHDGKDPSPPGTALITVSPVNDPPVAGDVAVLVIENTLKAVAAMPVTDVDDVAWTVSHLVGPLNGSISGFDPATGSFDYTPDMDYVGLDSISYQADDGDDPSNTGVVRIEVVASCECDCHADVECNGVASVFDVVFCVGEAFRSEPPSLDPNPSCPLVSDNDVNVSGDVNVFDVVFVVNMAFRNGPRVDNICDPCTGFGPCSP